MPLLSLPDELLINIVGALDHDDLFDFRWVCRKFLAISLDDFCARCFSHLSIDYDSNGLHKLVDITARPHLLKRLDHVSFAAVTIGPENRGHRAERVRNSLSPPRRPWTELVFQWNDHVDETFLTTGTDLQLLTKRTPPSGPQNPPCHPSRQQATGNPQVTEPAQPRFLNKYKELQTSRFS